MLEYIAANFVLRLLVLLAVFALVAFTVLAIASVLSHRAARQARLREVGHPGIVPRGTTGNLRSHDNDSAWARLAQAVEAAGIDLTDTRQDRLSAFLRGAGYTSPTAPRVFTLIRLVLVFALPLAYLAVDFLFGEPPTFFRAYLLCAAFALLGLYMPNLIVRIQADNRRDEVRRGFPDCLELMIVCVESGLGIEAAMDRVGREMVRSHPLIAELLSLTTLQLRAGATREEAFRRLGVAAGIEEIRSFTTLLIQSDKLGTSITATLRVYAEEMREHRQLRAEERAHRLPVLISIPLVVCMLPTMIGVLMLPAVIRLVRDVFPMMFSGG